MPYITKDRRQVLKEGCKQLVDTVEEHMQGPGELNFVFSLLARVYLEKFGKNYSTMNEIIGVFTSAKDEFYRRVVAPYEEDKITENGDVY
jgi:hypothetical protein